MHMLRSIGWLTRLRHFFTFLTSSVGSKFSVLICFFLHFGRWDFPENVLPTDESSIFQLTSGNCLHHQAALFLLKIVQYLFSWALLYFTQQNVDTKASRSMGQCVMWRMSWGGMVQSPSLTHGIFYPDWTKWRSSVECGHCFIWILDLLLSR